MKTIPETRHAAVLRTDFSDDQAWDAICDQIRAPSGDFSASVDCVSDRALANMDFEEFADAADSDGVFRGFG